jgi:hypothetical protein
MTTATSSSLSTSPHDPATDLCRHLHQCDEALGAWFGTAMWAERVHGLLAPRFATTVALAGLMLTIAFGWL